MDYIALKLGAKKATTVLDFDTCEINFRDKIDSNTTIGAPLTYAIAMALMEAIQSGKMACAKYATYTNVTQEPIYHLLQKASNAGNVKIKFTFDGTPVEAYGVTAFYSSANPNVVVQLAFSILVDLPGVGNIRADAIIGMMSSSPAYKIYVGVTLLPAA